MRMEGSLMEMEMEVEGAGDESCVLVVLAFGLKDIALRLCRGEERETPEVVRYIEGFNCIPLCRTVKTTLSKNNSCKIPGERGF